MRRSPRASRPRAGACPRRWSHDTLRRLEAGRQRAARRVPTRRHRARVVRPGRAALAAPALAGAPAARGRAGAGRGARRASCRPGTASAAKSGSLDRLLEVVGQLEGAVPAVVGLRARRAARARARLPAAPARRAVRLAASWSGSAAARSAPTTAAWRCSAASGSACWRRPRPRSRRPSRSTSAFATTWPGAAPRSSARSSRPSGGPTDAAVLEALWDLVWSGEITNDTLTPAAPAAAAPRAGRVGPCTSRAAARPKPPDAGRWCRPAAAGTDRAHALALSLLERHGVVTRESVLGEGVPGGFAAVYPVLRAMEEAGKIRRGYFVEGLGAAQFALPGAVDRLRAERTPVDGPTVQRPGRGRSGQSVRRHPGLAEGQAQAPARRRRLCRPGRRRAGAVRRAQSQRPVTLPALRAARAARARRPAPPGRKRRHAASWRIERVDGEPVAQLTAAAAARTGRLPARIPRPDACACRPLEPSSGAECLKATRSFRPPPRCGRCSSANRSCAARARTPGPADRSASSARASLSSSPSANTCSSASTTAWRCTPTCAWPAPGTATRPASAGASPPGKPASSSKCPTTSWCASTRRWPSSWTTRAVALHPALAVARARPSGTCIFEPTRPFSRLRSHADARNRRGPARSARHGRHRQRLQKRNPVHRVASTPGRRVARSRRRQLARADRHRAPPAARQRHAWPPATRHHPRRPDRARQRCTSTAAPTEPCTRCGTPIRVRRQGALNRPTYWCPRCQPQTSASAAYIPDSSSIAAYCSVGERHHRQPAHSHQRTVGEAPVRLDLIQPHRSGQSRARRARRSRSASSSFFRVGVRRPLDGRQARPPGARRRCDR